MAKRSPEAATDASAVKITSLNRISLSEPDIDKSVSLVKQYDEGTLTGAHKSGKIKPGIISNVGYAQVKIPSFVLDGKISIPNIGRLIASLLIVKACLDSGFFYVVDHGIDKKLMEEIFAQSKFFFDLPLDEKMKLLRNKKSRGYTPTLDETLDPDNQISGDYKEGYYIGVEVSEDDPQAEKPFYGPNLWPPADLLPGWRETMESYHKEALRVAQAVARIIARALDLDANFFDSPVMLGEPIATLRLLHYEGKITNPEKGIFGAGAHSDYGLITLLATDDVIGLQICKDKDARPRVWEYVEPLSGGFIVNLGDMLERWSNGIFRSTLHRVILDGRERYSIAYFVEPSHECLVECLPTCKSETNPPKFPAVTCSAYLLQRYKDTHADLNSYNRQS